MGARTASFKEGAAESKHQDATLYRPLPSYIKTDTKCIRGLNMILRTRKIQEEMLGNWNEQRFFGYGPKSTDNKSKNRQVGSYHTKLQHNTESDQESKVTICRLVGKKRPSSQIFHKSYQVHKNYNSINNEAESIAQIAECFSKIFGISLGSVHNTTQIQAWWHKLLRKEKWGIQKSKVIFSYIINLRPAWATWCHVFKKWY